MVLKLSNRQIKKFLEEIVGKNGVAVLEACQKPIIDEKIASRTKLRLNTVRSILNQLHYTGLVAYDREKNQKTNWYTYTWYARNDKIAEVIQNHLIQKLDELRNKLDYESSYIFYECKNKCEKLPFELAVEYDFKCPDCGTELKSINNRKAIREVVQEIKEVEYLIERLKPKRRKKKSTIAKKKARKKTRKKGRR